MNRLYRSVLGLFVMSTFLWGCPSDSDVEFDAELAGENEAMAVASPGMGTVNADLDDNTLTLTGSFEGLTSDLFEIAGSAAHIHRAAEGEDGPVVFSIDVTPGDNMRSGTLSLTVEFSDDQADDFRDELYYVNIHSVNYPGGELRAQLMDNSPTFEPVIWNIETDLGTDGMVDDVDTEGSGFVTSILRSDNAFVISGLVEGLTSALMDQEGSSVNLFRGAAGEMGELVRNLEVSVDEDERGAFFSHQSDFSEEERQWALDDELFIVVHTTDFPDGELRAQLSLDEPADRFEVELAGDNEVPPVASPATGMVSVSLVGSIMQLTGSFEGLTSDLIEIQGSSAHIHLGGPDETGPIVVNIDVSPGEDMRSGDLELVLEFDEEQVQAFNDGLYYVNIHTESYPGGELRVQLVADAPVFEAVQWDTSIELSTEAQPVPVVSDATGFATAILREDNTFIISGEFENLSSPLTEVEGSGVNIFLASSEEVGEHVYTVQVLSDDGLSGTFHEEITLGEEELEWLTSDRLFLNIHTETFPDGEIRGQIMEDEFVIPPF